MSINSVKSKTSLQTHITHLIFEFLYNPEKTASSNEESVILNVKHGFV